MKAMTKALRNFLQTHKTYTSCELITLSPNSAPSINLSDGYNLIFEGANSATLNPYWITNLDQDVVHPETGVVFSANSGCFFIHGSILNTNTLSTSTLDATLSFAENSILPKNLFLSHSGVGIKIEKCYLDGITPIGCLTLFEGRVQDVVQDRYKIEIKIASPTLYFGKQFPSQVFSAMCANSIYDSGCKLKQEIMPPSKLISGEKGLWSDGGTINIYTGILFGGRKKDGKNDFTTDQNNAPLNWMMQDLKFSRTYQLGLYRKKSKNIFVFPIVNTSCDDNSLNYYHLTVNNLSAAFLNGETPIHAVANSYGTIFYGCNRTLTQCSYIGNTTNFAGFPVVPPKSIVSGQVGDAKTTAQTGDVT